MSSDHTSDATVLNDVSDILPPFWVDSPTVWFGQAGAQFALKVVTISSKHFYYVISCLPQDITDASAASTYDGL